VWHQPGLVLYVVGNPSRDCWAKTERSPSSSFALHYTSLWKRLDFRLAHFLRRAALRPHDAHTQAESFYNFAYVRRFLVLVRFKNRPHVLNLTDVTPCPESLVSLSWKASSKVDCEHFLVCAGEQVHSAMATDDIERTQIELPLNSEIIYNYLDNCAKIEIFGTNTSFVSVQKIFILPLLD